MRPLKLIPDNTNFRFLRWNWGVDFVGGQQMRVTFAQAPDIGALRSRLGALNVGDVTIQQLTDKRTVDIRVPLEGSQNPIGKCLGSSGATAMSEDTNKIASAVRTEIVKAYPGVNVGSVNSVSGKVGCELFSTGSLALTLAMAGIALFIWFRFEWQFGIGALVTLAHDVILTFGFFALTQLQFDLNVVAAILTIIGYSLNDTIVCYDRIRENLRKYRSMDIQSLIDLSTNETLSRTVTTSLSLVITLAILLLIGPDTIFGFTAAMLLGIVIGTFSSFYISNPTLLWLKVTSDSFLEKGAVRPGANADAERVTLREK
jgi:preprotein translocase subunit SecF